MMNSDNDKKILESWHKNVTPWTKAIQQQEIATRVQITDQAIINTVCGLTGRSVIDIGCGEGWLSRALFARGFETTGIDAVSGLIQKAHSISDGNFHVLAYEQLSASSLLQRYDIGVCNFSLLGEAAVEQVFAVMPTLLNSNGKFVVQTLHPHTACGDQSYDDGWRNGCWNGFSDDFVDPPPWYFRTIESWFKLFSNNSMRLVQFHEPVNPATAKAASLIMVGEVSP